MANSKWGTKRMCLSCGKRFYDMRRDPIFCPACDAPFELSTPTRTRRQRAPAVRQFRPPPPAPRGAAEDGAEATIEGAELAGVVDEKAGDDVEVEEQAAETIEDPSELGEDEDDMAEVIESREEPEKTDM